MKTHVSALLPKAKPPVIEIENSDKLQRSRKARLALA